MLKTNKKKKKHQREKKPEYLDFIAVNPEQEVVKGASRPGH